MDNTFEIFIKAGLIGFFLAIVAFLLRLWSTARINKKNRIWEDTKWQLNFHREVLDKVDTALLQTKEKFHSDQYKFVEVTAKRNNICENIFKDIGYLMDNEAYDLLCKRNVEINIIRLKIQKKRQQEIEITKEELDKLLKLQSEFSSLFVNELHSERIRFMRKIVEIQI